MTPREEQDAKAKLKELRDRVEQAKGARRAFETEWYMNLAFYQGEHWLAWARGRFSRPQLERWRILFTDNRVQPIVRTEVAKMTKQRPDWTATPTGTDDRAVATAVRSERLLDSRWSTLGCQRKLRMAVLWARIAGRGYWRITWDRNTGTGVEMIVDANGDPFLNPRTQLPMRADEIPEGMPLGEGLKVEKMSEGEAHIEVRSPFDILPDPLATDEGVASCRWIIEECLRSPEYLKDRYDVDLKPDAKAVTGVTEDRMPGGQPSHTGGEAGVRVWEMFERPSHKHPQGRHVVWTEKALLADEHNPTHDQGLPYISFDGIPVPGRYHPTSITTQIRPLNAEMNKTRSQMRESAARFGNPILLIPGDQQATVYGVPGEQVKIDPYAPQTMSYLEPPSIPGYVQNEPVLLESAMREVSGQHEITHGNVPAGVTAASAINLLQEQDDTRLGPDIWDMERSISEAGQMLLTLMAAHYKTDRLVAIAGDDGAWDIDSFRSDMLSDVPQIQVQPGSMFPQSKAAKQAAMKDMLALFLQYGVPMSAHDLGKFIRGFDVGGLERLVAGFSQNETQVARENMVLMSGQQLPVNDFDDDQSHLEGHAEVLKSRRYQLLPAEAQAALLSHWQAHQARVQQQEQEQMMQAMMAAAPSPAGSNGAPAGGNQPAPVAGLPTGAQ